MPAPLQGGGLRRHGFAEVAHAIAVWSRELVERAGFDEFYPRSRSGRPPMARGGPPATMAP